MQLYPYFVNGVCISVAKNCLLIHSSNCICPVNFGVKPGMVITLALHPDFQLRDTLLYNPSKSIYCNFHEHMLILMKKYKSKR